MAYPTNLEDQTFEKISQIIRGNMRPPKKLVVGERTKFISMKQEIDEQIIKCQYHLRNSIRYCVFEKLRQEKQRIEEKLTQSRLIDGMYNASHRHKIIEQLQIGNMSLNICIDYIQQQELIQKYNQDKSQSSEQIFADIYMLIFFKCSYCAYEHEIEKEKCPTFGKTCTDCLKKNHFQALSKFKRKCAKRAEENESNMEVFPVKNRNKNVEKI